jgi:isopentenyl-diphosphate delta-isomerase
MKTQKRKSDHLNICLSQDVESGRTNGFEEFELAHNALPELDFSEVDTSTVFLGKKFSVPIIIEAMTGGSPEAGRINKNLARAAQELGIGMGLGSQRAMLEDPSLSATFRVRDVAPTIFIAGNIGASHIQGMDASRLNEAIEQIGADALAIHLNAGQEIAQFSGHDRWRGVFEAIRRMRPSIKRPVIVKEVGCGISGDVAARLSRTGVNAIDVAGVGGTSWIKVDSLITGKKLDNFFGWGIQTARCVEQCARSVKMPIIASGGIRNGIEVAKSIALGASLAGMALPLLGPATRSPEAVREVLEKVIMELKVSMFLTGSKNLGDLRAKAARVS